MAQVVTKGWDDLGRVLAAMPADIDRAAKIVVTQSALLIEAEAKRNFIGSHSRREPHVGGNRPNVATGMLRRSILTVGPTSPAQGEWTAQVGPTAVYGRRVELGYPGGAGRGRQRTRPFPYLRPAVESSTWQIRSIALAQWARLFK
jgi:hypothetical protein